MRAPRLLPGMEPVLEPALFKELPTKIKRKKGFLPVNPRSALLLGNARGMGIPRE